MLHTSFYIHTPSTVYRRQRIHVFAYLKTVFNEISIPLSFSNLWSWVAMVSLSFSICWSTNSLTRWVIFDILPDPGLLIVQPVFSYTFRNFLTPTFDTWMPSSSNSNFAIVYGFSPLLWWQSIRSLTYSLKTICKRNTKPVGTPSTGRTSHFVRGCSKSGHWYLQI